MKKATGRGKTERGVAIIRQWKILGLIKSHHYGVSVKEIAEYLETPIRTIYRDLQILASVVPIYNDKAVAPNKKGWQSVYKLQKNDVL